MESENAAVVGDSGAVVDCDAEDCLGVTSPKANVPNLTVGALSREQGMNVMANFIDWIDSRCNSTLLHAYLEWQVVTGVRAGKHPSAKWIGITSDNEELFSLGVKELCGKGLDKALWAQRFPLRRCTDPQQPSPDDLYCWTDEDRVNTTIIKWRHFTSSGDLCIPLTREDWVPGYV